MMTEINIKQEEKKCIVDLGLSLRNNIIRFLTDRPVKSKIAIITDTNVEKVSSALLSALSVFEPIIISVPPGEASKTREMKQNIEDRLLKAKLGKDSIIIALGGGVVSDLAGFVASTYNRGIPFVIIPTTLLAMIDASIGGKTGVNTEEGKNLIGCFHQPEAVFCDISFLKTLSEEETLNGIAEAIKIALAMDKELFDFIKDNRSMILKKEKEPLLKLISKCIQLKKEVVESDPLEESGARQVLNLGHTIGHAVEKASAYSIKHGFCVSIGIAVESKIAVITGNLNPAAEKEILSLLEDFGLPVKIDKSLEIGAIMGNLPADKKSVLGTPRFVLLDAIGAVKSRKNPAVAVDNKIVTKAIGECIND